MKTSLRGKMAESIVKSGDTLVTLELNKNNRLWYIKDGKSYNDPFGREPQYQVWKGEKRLYVGSNRHEAYAKYNEIKEEE